MTLNHKTIEDMMQFRSFISNAVFTYDQFDLSTITPIAKARKYSLYRVNHENEEAYSFGRNFAI